MAYSPKTFTLPSLAGISEKQVAVHLALYEGYVKHVNLILEKLSAVRAGTLELDPYIVAELRRRFGFEFDGMRLHEYYFEQLERPIVHAVSSASGYEGERGDVPLTPFASAVIEKYGSEDAFVSHVKEVAGTRGIGWVVVSADPGAATLHTTFVADHELGHLAGLPIILALDLWEHAYMVDYVPADKKNYIDAFFTNLNWSVVEKRYDAAMSAA